MKHLFQKLAIFSLFVAAFNVQDAHAQGWTFPYPTEGTPCGSCVPAGWTMVSGSPDISSLDNWIGYSHYGPVAAIAPVPEPTPGVTSFMSAVAWGAYTEEVTTTFILPEAEVLTIYFAGFGTSSSGGGPGGAEPGVTEAVLVNGTAASVPIPWDGEWHAVTYDLPAGSNTIIFNPNLDDDDTRHAVHISIPADQPSDCTEDLITDISSEDICLGDELTLEATSVGGGTVTWDNDVENGVPFTPDAAAIITYTATSDDPVDCPFSVEIVIRNLPIIDAGEDTTLCEGGEVTLTGDGAGVDGVYAWTDGVEDGVPFVPAISGTYTVTGTDSHGCENTDDVDVIVNPLPAVDAGEDMTICVGVEITLAGTGAGIDGIYDWTDGVMDGEPFTPDETMTYTVTGTDENGCVNTDDILVTLYDAPPIDAGEDQQVCEGEEVTLTGSGAGDGGTYDWTDGVMDGEAFTPAVTTIYTVTGTDINGCEGTDDVTVTVNALPAVDAGPDVSVCQGDEITLAGSGAGVGGVYDWSDGITDGASFAPVASGDYTLTGTDANGCVNTDNVTVTLNPLPDVTFSGAELTGCYPHTVNFDTPSTGDTFSWTFGDGSISNVEDPSHTYMTDGDFDVTLTITSAAGCVSTLSYFDYVSISPPPNANFNFVTNDVAQGESSAQFQNLSDNATDFEWDFGDGSPTSNVFSPTHLFPGISESGYPVQLVAINSIGCRDSITKLVRMKDILIYYMPNTFTPDGDNFNEEFKPVFVSGFDPYDFHMMIFNRWGEMVFESYDANYGWNGFYGNQGIVRDGIYVWRIEFGDLHTDKKYYEEGHVNILR